MWIRSQDLTVLVKFQGIYIDSRFSLWTDGYLLGEYSSKTKAKDVLNLIEKCLTEYQSNYVFNMPQDNEIDEF